MILSCIIADFFKKLLYIGPSRKLPQEFPISSKEKDSNLYVGSDGYRIGSLLQGNRFIVQKINNYLSRLNIDYHIEINPTFRKDNDEKTFKLQIYRNYTHISSYLSEVGFGISQVIPIVVQSLLSEERPIMIEQPELHLHPALQAELGDLFIDSALQKNNTLLIETHSEHILLRIMRRIRETTNGTLPEGITPIRAEDVSVVYVESVETDCDRHSIIREMPLNEQGELIKAWPGGFFEEGLNEVF